MLAEIIGWDIAILGVVLIAGLVPLGLAIWAVIDIAQRSEASFQAAGQSKTTWLLLVILLTLFCGLPGAVLALIYLVSIRPKVAAVSG
jgi:hypothetical protein